MQGAKGATRVRQAQGEATRAVLSAEWVTGKQAVMRLEHAILALSQPHKHGQQMLAAVCIMHIWCVVYEPIRSMICNNLAV